MIDLFDLIDWIQDNMLEATLLCALGASWFFFLVLSLWAAFR